LAAAAATAARAVARASPVGNWSADWAATTRPVGQAGLEAQPHGFSHGPLRWRGAGLKGKGMGQPKGRHGLRPRVLGKITDHSTTPCW
jgi:hypothetical protein